MPKGSVASAGDYSVSVGNVSIAGGAKSGTATLTALDDSADEPREVLRLGLGALVSGIKAGSPSHVDVTTVNGDPTVASLARCPRAAR